MASRAKIIEAAAVADALKSSAASASRGRALARWTSTRLIEASSTLANRVRVQAAHDQGKEGEGDLLRQHHQEENRQQAHRDPGGEDQPECATGEPPHRRS